MASTHIEIVSTASRYAAAMRSLVTQLRAVQELGQECKDVGDQIAAGADWTAYAAYLGLSGDSAATNAEAVYNLLGSVNTTLSTDAFFAQFLSRLG